MKLFKKEQLISVISSLILFAAVPVVFAWTSPSSTPPDGNVPAPIHVGQKSQIKQGFLGLYGSSTGMAISKNDTRYSLLNDLSLGVKGKIGADLYCNADGTRCADIDQLIGSTVVNNTTVENGCKFEQSTFNVKVSASAGNNRQDTQKVNLIAGTWTVSGSGKSVSCSGDACGNHIISAKVTKNRSAGSGAKTLMSKSSKAEVHNWKISETTFTLTQTEQLIMYVDQGTLTGNLTFTGPKLVCPTN